MVRVGIVGIGFMGWIHYLAYQRVPGVKLVAFAETDPVKLTGDWRNIQGNFGPPGEQVDLKKLQAFSNLDDMLAHANVDLVDVCLPPSLHADVTVRALQQGKHVFCEKPMALMTADCKRMVDAARQHDRMLFIGHVLPMFPEYCRALQIIHSGKYGGLLGGHFRRVISDPLWLKDFYNPQRIGGPMLDLHVHDAHLIRMLFGMPRTVTSQGRMRGEVVEYANSFFEFEDPNLVVSATSGVIHQQGRSFTHGFEIHLEKATLLYESAVLGGEGTTVMPLTVLDSKGKVVRPELPAGDAIAPFVAEIKEVTRSLRSGKPSPVLDGDLARDAIVLCHKQTESVRKRKTVRV